VAQVSGYPYQSTDHDASISAESVGREQVKVAVEVVRGEKKPVRIVMWREDFDAMVRDVRAPNA
jgi:hypothetical protein